MIDIITKKRKIEVGHQNSQLSTVSHCTVSRRGSCTNAKEHTDVFRHKAKICTGGGGIIFAFRVTGNTTFLA